MSNHPHRNRQHALVISAISLPIGLFAAYLAYLVVPVILSIVVPTVVRVVVAGN